jgi:hypothetical protein
MVYFTSRWPWTALLGLFLTGLIWVGVFATPGTAYRLHHPQDVGTLIGTLVQLAGLLLALMAGVGTVVVRFRNSSRNRSTPQG